MIDTVFIFTEYDWNEGHMFSTRSTLYSCQEGLRLFCCKTSKGKWQAQVSPEKPIFWKTRNEWKVGWIHKSEWQNQWRMQENFNKMIQEQSSPGDWYRYSSNGIVGKLHARGWQGVVSDIVPSNMVAISEYWLGNRTSVCVCISVYVCLFVYAYVCVPVSVSVSEWRCN